MLFFNLREQALGWRCRAADTWSVARVQLNLGVRERGDRPDPRRADGTQPRAILKSAPERGSVRVDEDTQLTGIPSEAWSYRLGSRSAIDWVLDQYKEKTPRDQTIRERFDAYRFADYKESAITLIAKVVRISMDTLSIVGQMRAVARDEV